MLGVKVGLCRILGLRFRSKLSLNLLLMCVRGEGFDVLSAMPRGLCRKNRLVLALPNFLEECAQHTLNWVQPVCRMESKLAYERGRQRDMEATRFAFCADSPLADCKENDHQDCASDETCQLGDFKPHEEYPTTLVACSLVLFI